MVLLIPRNLLGAPELQTVGQRAPVKAVVVGAIFPLQIGHSLHGEELCHCQVANYAQ